MAVSTYQGAQTATVDAPQVRTHKWLVAAAVMVGAFLQVLDSTVVNVALPHMQGSFAASVDEITWVVTSYLVATSVMVPLTGWLAARFGRKRYFLISIAMFVGASALCGLAQRLDQMVVFRLLQGASGAAMMPLSQAILLETFPPAEHTLAMSTFGLGMMVAPMLGPTVGGWITMNWSWRWNFYINVPAGAIAALLVFLFVHDPPYLRERRGRGRIGARLHAGLGALDDPARLARVAISRSDHRFPDAGNRELRGRHLTDLAAGRALVQRQPDEPALHAGAARLRRLEGGPGRGPARYRRGRRADNGWTVGAPRRRRSPAGDARRGARRLRHLEHVGLEPPGEHDFGTVADNPARPGAGIILSDRDRRRSQRGSARTDGLCDQPLRDDDQCRRRDRSCEREQHPHVTRADASGLPRTALFSVRRMEDEPHGAPDAGPAVSRFRAPADDGAKAATRSGLRDDSVAGVAARVQRRLPDARDSRVRDRAVVSIPAAHPRPPRPGDRVTMMLAGTQPLGRPSCRSPRILRWISLVPPAIVY